MNLKTIFPSTAFLFLASFCTLAQIAPPDSENLFTDTDGSWSHHVLETDDGNLLISGTNFFGLRSGCVTLRSPNGDSIWRTPLNGIDTALHAIELSDAFIVIGSNDFNSLIYNIQKDNGQVRDSIVFGCGTNCFGIGRVGKHALLALDSDSFVVGGYIEVQGSAPAGAIVNIYSADLGGEQNLFYDNAMGDQVIDIERATNDDILFFGTIGFSTTCDDAPNRNLGVEDDIWILRVDGNLELVDVAVLDNNVDENFIDATPTDDNGFAILGWSDDICPTHDEVADFDWIRKFNYPVNFDQTIGTQLTNNAANTSTSILYDDGYLVTSGGGYGAVHLSFYDLFINLLWNNQEVNIDTEQPGCYRYQYSYAIKASSGCYYIVGECRDPTSEFFVSKILDRWGDCQFVCENSTDIMCGQDRTDDTSDPDLISQINDYSLCGEDRNFAQPEFVYRITEFGDNETDIYVSMQELGAQQGGLDVFVIANCDEDTPLNSDGLELVPTCIDKAIRNGGDLPAMIRISQPDPNNEYYIIVDSRNTPGDFRVSVSCPEDCANDAPLECDMPRPDLNNNTNGSSKICAYYRPIVGQSGEYFDQYTGSEYKVPFTAQEAGTYTINLTGLTSNLDMFVMSECNPFLCLDYSRETGTTSESIEISLDALQTIYISVDARADISSSFVLEVVCCNGEPSCACEDAEELMCGNFAEGNTADLTESRINNYSLCGENQDFAQPEYIYRISGFDNGPTNIYIGMQELGTLQGGLDLFAIANCDLSNGEENITPICLDKGIRNAGDPPALITIPEADANTEYFVIVDSRNTPGDFRVSISCPENCADAPTIDCDSPRELNNARDGSSKISSYYLPETGQYIDQYDGIDYKVPFVAPRDGNYTFRLSGLTENVVDMFIIEECNPFQCIAFTNDQESSIEEIDLALGNGDTVFVIVDAMAGNSTTCTLTVECCEAFESNVFLMGGSEDTTVCISEGISQVLTLEHETQALVEYTYVLTNDNDVIIMEVGPSLDVSSLSIGTYRIYGVSYEGLLSIPVGQNIDAIESDVCYVLSTNSISVRIGEIYEVTLDTTICAGEALIICDSELSVAGQDTIVCTSQSGCDSIIYVTLRINEPIVDITGPSAFCSGEEIEISASEGFVDYEWSNEETSVSITLAEPGIYTVTVTDGEGCIASAETEIEEVIPPVVDLIEDVEVCDGNSYPIEASSDCTDCTFSWSPAADFDDPNILNPTVSPSTSTQYVLQTTTSDNVCTVFDSIGIAIIPRLILELENDHFVYRRNNESTLVLDSIFRNDTIRPENRKVRSNDVDIELDRRELPPEIDLNLGTNGIDVVIGSILDLHSFRYILTDRTCRDTASAIIQLQIIPTDIICLCNPDEESTGCVLLSDIEMYDGNLTSIFDRQGNMVHLAKDYNNDWRGIHMQTGERVPTGTYYFVMNLGPRKDSTTGMESTIKGVITIIRR